MKPFLLNVPEGMLERWRETAAERGISMAQFIRDAVNRDIETPATLRFGEEDLLEDGWET
jgi:hypothetical protein